MKRSSTIFLQIVIVLFGLAALAFLLLMPRVEGRNAHATNFEIYFQDPLLAIAYLGSIPFFIALYQAITILRYVGRNEVFSPDVVKALRTIRYCALAVIGFVVVAVLFILVMDKGDEDSSRGGPHDSDKPREFACSHFGSIRRRAGHHGSEQRSRYRPATSPPT